MAKKEETSLQLRIQKLIESRGGYVIKTHGDMISEPGIADLIFCYKGLFIAMEVKVGDNKPTVAQGIQLRKVKKANGIPVVVWSTYEVSSILNVIDRYLKDPQTELFPVDISTNINNILKHLGVDDGSSY